MLGHLSISFLLPGALLNIFVPSTCVEHSDWSYDRDTDTIYNISANGTVAFSCTKIAVLNAHRQSCKNCSQYLSETFSPDQIMVVKIISEALFRDNVTCVPAVPTREEIFERIDSIYQSSTNNSLASKSWFGNITCNISNEILAMNRTDTVIKEARLAVWSAFVAYNLTKGELHDMRLEIAGLEVELLSLETIVKEHEEMTTLKKTTDRIDELQHELPVLEMLAVSEKPEFAPSTWALVADSRSVIMDYVLLEMIKKDRIIRNQQEAASARINLVSKKAQANAKVAVIEQLMNEVTYHMEQAQLADRGDEIEIYF